jgi:cell wall-associated NlpC family hydrolase
MFFTICLPGRSAPMLRAPFDGVVACFGRGTMMVALAGAMVLGAAAPSAWAQSSAKTPATSQGPKPAAEQAGAVDLAPTGGPESETPTGGADVGDDAFSRMLSEKGLLGGAAKPVVELAQQMRNKAGSVAGDLVVSAMNFLGVPYRRGGTSSEGGFDCSGFTRHVFENSLGLVLPRRAAEQAKSPELLPVKKDELKPGDLVFFNTLRHTFSHVGIYIGDNKFIHSPRAGGRVRVEDMRMAYWQQRFDGARRAPPLEASQANPSGKN